MSFDAIMKVIYVGFSIYLVQSLSFSSLVSILFALTISHNTLAFVYSKSQRKYLAENWRSHFTPLLILGVLISVMMAYDAPAIHFLFAIHHVFNEVFLVQRRLPGVPKALQISRIILATFVFYSATRDTATYLPEFHVYFWQLTVIASGVLFMGVLFWKRKELPKGWITKEIFFEGSSFAVGLWCAFNQSGTLDHVLLYHFLLWSVYPLQKLWQNGLRPTFNYVFWTLFLFGIALPFTPLSYNWGGLNLDELSHITRITAYFHFCSSFALSQAHPMWIRRWFIKIKPHFEAPNKAA